jgi:hypothetical protein
MRKILVTFIFLAFVSLSFAAQPKIDMAGIKQQIVEELLELKKDLNSAKTQLDSLVLNNQQIKVALNDMEAWGLLQQEEKEKYYNQTVEAVTEISSVRGQLDQEKALRAKISANYARVKNVMACLFGALLAIVVYKITNSFLAPAGVAVLPQIKLLGFLAPISSFVVGYILVYLYF